MEYKKIKEEKRNLQDDYDKLKEDYEQLLKDMESLKNNKNNSQQTTNVTILNNLNNTNIISKTDKKGTIYNEVKKEEAPITKSMVVHSIKKIDIDLTKNNENKNDNNINNIIYDVNNNINNIINQINNNINSNEVINNKNNKTTSTGVSLTFNITSNTNNKTEKNKIDVKQNQGEEGKSSLKLNKSGKVGEPEDNRQKKGGIFTEEETNAIDEDVENNDNQNIVKV